MAKKESRFKNIKAINSTLNTINSIMNGIYKDTYNSDRSTQDSINKISQDIEDNIASIMSKNDMTDISNVSKLYSRARLETIKSDKELANKVTGLFEDPAISANILAMYTENRWVRDLDIEIDTVLKYMPRLQEALNAMKENVLSSDNFAKDFLNDTSNNINDQTEQALFATRMQSLKEKYKLQAFYDETYDRVSKYGEEFIYCVPYSKAIGELIQRKANTRLGAAHGKYSTYSGVLESESGSVKEVSIIESGHIKDQELSKKISSITANITDPKQKISIPENFKVTFDNRGILESAYTEYKDIENQLTKVPSSIYESVLEAGGTKKVKFDTTVPDQLEVPKNFDKETSRDGFISLGDSNNNSRVKVPGSVLKRLKRENVIPIYIDQTCLGYYYIEFLAGSTYDIFVTNDTIYAKDNIASVGHQPNTRNFSAEAIEEQRNRLLAYFAGTIAQNIDATFVNNNQDLTKEIYNILKFNDVFNAQSIDNIRVSFLPESDVEHIFFKQDPVTHRGISDLMYALIPAKLYACLYITNTLGILTRGNDKRVYYVKQNVEQNIAQTMLNVINQIKRGNFGMREIENMNTILNITGRFNDYVIPVGPSGESPVQFEVMQGQEFNPNTELMDKLEEMAINSTGMPIEYIQNRMQSLDFAVQATTVNAKVLRVTYKRQSLYEYYLSRIQTKLYNTEYNENIKVSCSLPTPIFLYMTNINQMIDNTRQHIQAIADYEYEAETANDSNADAKKAIFIRHMMRKKLQSYVKLNEIEDMKKLAEMEFNKQKPSSDNDGM